MGGGVGGARLQDTRSPPSDGGCEERPQSRGHRSAPQSQPSRQTISLQIRPTVGSRGVPPVSQRRLPFPTIRWGVADELAPKLQDNDRGTRKRGPVCVWNEGAQNACAVPLPVSNPPPLRGAGSRFFCRPGGGWTGKGEARTELIDFYFL